MKNEIFRDKVPWLDESMSLVGVQEGNKARLDLVRLDNKSGVDIMVCSICNFDGGDVMFLRFITGDEKGSFALEDSEILCLSIIPKGFNIMKMAEILKDPFWQYVLNHFKASFIMDS